jgi:cytochrome c5
MVRLVLRHALFAFAVCAAAGACHKDSAKQAPAAAPAVDPAVDPAVELAQAEARQLFDTTCAICHGANGHGDGPGAAAINPKPRNYTDKAWQASVTDDDLRKIILQGGAAVGKSPLMPPGRADLKTKPLVLNALVALIRDFGK